MELMQDLRERWDESEFRLNFLRSITGAVLNEPTDEHLREWAAKTGGLCCAWPSRDRRLNLDMRIL